MEKPFCMLFQLGIISNLKLIFGTLERQRKGATGQTRLTMSITNIHMNLKGDIFFSSKLTDIAVKIVFFVHRVLAKNSYGQLESIISNP